MKTFISFAAMAAGALAHYNLPAMIYQGKQTADWVDVRQWTNYYTFQPVTDVSSLDIQCNAGASSPVAGATGILSVAAGQQLGFEVSPDIYHPGPALVYMAKVPAGQTAATWTPSGDVWFKVAEFGVKTYSPALTWVTDSAANVTFTIPESTPNGDYLVRVEHIALHVAGTTNGAQFYLSCGQVTVTGGGSGTPSPTVAFPGAYSATDPGILINIYYPVPTSYTFPGPAVWTG